MTRHRRYTLDGRSLTLTGWASSAGLHPTTLQQRLAEGQPLAQALASPPLTKSQAGRRGAAVSPWRHGYTHRHRGAAR